MTDPCPPKPEAYRYTTREVADERDRRYSERFAAQERAVEAALKAASDAVAKAERSMEARLEGMNEFRKQMADERGLYATREAVASIEKRLDLLTGRGTGRSDVVGWIVAAVAVGVAIVDLALRK